jgi:hypothetical protein
MCLRYHMDRVARDHAPTNLFRQAPTIHFQPEETGDGLKVLKSREKKVITLDIGPFRARETVMCDASGRVYYSNQLRALTPFRCTYGYDVLVYVGRALFIQHHSEQQIVKDLGEKNVSISLRQVGYLGGKFIAYLAMAHHQSRERLKKAMISRGGYILHLDGTCEGDSPHLFAGMDGLAGIVLGSIKLPSEKSDLIIPFLRRIKREYGEPIALVHDMGKGILAAVDAVFKGIPDFICHFHFLRDIGKDLFETEYAMIRNQLRKHKIRPLLGKKLKELRKTAEKNPEAVCMLARGIDGGRIDSSVMEKMPDLAACAMVHWTLDTSVLDGYGFPFDCPHLILYQRLKSLRDMVNAGRIKTKALLRLLKPLNQVVEDPTLKKAARKVEKKVQTFKKLRESLAIAIPQGRQGLNDDGGEKEMKTIEEKVKGFRLEFITEKDYDGMIRQIDKYWEKLFADPVTVNTPEGQIVIQPQRTNNTMERFFRDLKRGSRKRSGTISLNKALKFLLADTPLVKNLDNAEYVEILLDGCSTLEERFSRIDSNVVVERLRAERKGKQQITMEMRKIIRHPDLPERLTQFLTESNVDANRRLRP